MKTKSTRFAKILGLAIICSAIGGVSVWRAYAGPNVPQGIAYSGELLNNGVPDNALHSFTFDLLDNGGNEQCSDGPRAVATTAGRFDVANLFSGNCALDTILGTKTGLQIRITVDNIVLMPMQPIGVVPFAARARVAENAETAGSLVQTPAALGSADSVGDIVASLLTPPQFKAQRGAGWVLCDGTAPLMGTALGQITGANSVPDLRGQFLRGFNNGRNDGKGDADGDAHLLGTSQSDQVGPHTHQVPVEAGWAQPGGFPNNAWDGSQAMGHIDSKTNVGTETRPRSVAVNFYCRIN